MTGRYTFTVADLSVNERLKKVLRYSWQANRTQHGNCNNTMQSWIFSRVLMKQLEEPGKIDEEVHHSSKSSVTETPTLWINISKALANSDHCPQGSTVWLHQGASSCCDAASRNRYTCFSSGWNRQFLQQGAIGLEVEPANCSSTLVYCLPADDTVL